MCVCVCVCEEGEGNSLLKQVLKSTHKHTRECNALWGEPERAIEVCCRLSSTVEDSEFAKNVPIFTVSGL